MPDRSQGGPFWGGVQPPLQSVVAEGDLWWDGTTLWVQKSGSWTAVTGQGALPAGTVIEITSFVATATHSVTAASTTVGSVAVPANTYSKIRLRFIGWIHGTATSTLQLIHVTTSVGGDQRVEIAAAAEQYIPWSLEIVLIQKTATTINLQENSVADDANTTVGLTYIALEGVV